MVASPLLLLGRCLCEWKMELKVRIREQCKCLNIEEISSVHSGAEIRKEVDQFLLANSSQLLDTDPSEYYKFL